MQRGWFTIVVAGMMLTGSAAHAEPPIPRGEFLVVPLRVHLLMAADAPAVATTLGEEDIARILPKMNAVWAQAGVCFYLESLVREEAVNTDRFEENEGLRPGQPLLRLRPDPSKSSNVLHLYYIKRMTSNGIYFPEAMFVKDTASLRIVPGGVDEPLPRVSSHEIGHAFGLPHRQDTTNLMASGTTGTSFNQAEIDLARSTAAKLPWILPAAVILGQADELWDAGNADAARLLYQKLMPLAAECDAGGRIQERAGKPGAT